MSQSSRGERVTAVVSALAAIIILGAAVTAQQSRTAPANPLARLESDLRFQLYLAYRTNGDQLAQRLVELNNTLDAWQRSPRSGNDDRLLAEWLQASIRRSMPGEAGELPPMPEFGRPPAAAAAPPVTPVPQASAPERPTIAVAPKPQPPVRPKVASADSVESRTAGDSERPSVAAAPAAPTEVEHSVAKPIAVSTPKSPTAVAPPAHAVAEALPAPAPAPRPIEVNLAELNSRIAGYHHGVQDVEAALVAAGDDFTPAQLDDLVSKLEDLSQSYQFVCLYYDVLTDRERKAVTKPRPLLSTVELVDRKRVELEHGKSEDFLTAFEPKEGAPSALAPRLRAIASAAANALSAP